MQTNKILSASLIDIVFDGRNKAYGAYELRKTYTRRVTKALFIMTAIVSAGIFLSFAPLNNKAPAVTLKPPSDSVRITDVDERKPLPELPVRSQPAQQAQSATVPYTEMIIVEDNQVLDTPTTIAELEDADIGTVRIGGEVPTGIVEEPEIPGVEIGILDPLPKSNEPLSIVEIEARYSGNWENFLRKNLKPEVAVDNAAPPGNHTIIVQFVVDAEGNVSDIKPLTNIGYGMEQEAVRVLKKATKWQPAIQNGYPVKAYRRQPITFQVLED